jgi:hypothetical protein
LIHPPPSTLGNKSIVKISIKMWLEQSFSPPPFYKDGGSSPPSANSAARTQSAFIATSTKNHDHGPTPLQVPPLIGTTLASAPGRKSGAAPAPVRTLNHLPFIQ